MDVGTFDQRLVLQVANVTTDAFNEPIYTWVTLTTVWGMATPISDAERSRSNEIYATASYRFQIRYSSIVANIDAKDRVIWDGRTWDIIGVKAIGRDDRLELTGAARAERP